MYKGLNHKHELSKTLVKEAKVLSRYGISKKMNGVMNIFWAFYDEDYSRKLIKDRM